MRTSGLVNLLGSRTSAEGGMPRVVQTYRMPSRKPERATRSWADRGNRIERVWARQAPFAHAVIESFEVIFETKDPPA